LALRDRRISKDGVVIIKAQQYRTQEKNRQAALDRLQELIKSVAVVRKARKPTKPSKSSQAKRLDRKTRHGKTKLLAFGLSKTRAWPRLFRFLADQFPDFCDLLFFPALASRQHHFGFLFTQF
jgi:hypothetical protein